MIEVKNVSKWYGSFQVLTDCTTSTKKSEVMVVCGPSGSDKSILIKTVNVLGPFRKGEVFVDGISVGAKGTSLPKPRSRVDMMFQSFELLPHFSIAGSLTIAWQRVLDRSEEGAMAESLKYLDRVGLKAHAAKYPGQPSGGQQQRVAIARALSMDPVCMLFNEPTSTLGPEMVNEVLDVMVELTKEGMAMMYVTHEMGFARKVTDRVIFADQGHTVEDCEREEFFGSIGVRPGRARQFLSKVLSH